MSGHDFHASVTDSGLCHTYNGNGMKQTYSPSNRVKALSSSLDQRNHVSSMKIQGTELAHKKVFWLNLADR